MNPTHDEQQAAKNDPSTEGALWAIFRWMQAQDRQQATERKRDRRWSMVKTSVFALALLSTPLYLWVLDLRYGDARLGKNYVAMVRIDGVIAADHPANSRVINQALEKAFEDPKARGVVVVINSPGGTPVQASAIHDRLIALRETFPEKPVWAVGEDMMTSGAYFIATAAPKVCVNRSTLTGSIGVIRDGWGFDKAIRRIDIERRVFTAGASKSRLDPFRPLTADDQAKAKEMLEAVHAHFKDVVREGRGERLKGSEAELFSGDFWTGDRALALGLVDRLCGDVNDVVAAEYGVTDIKDYTPPPSLVSKLAGAIGTQVRSGIVGELEGALQPMLLPR